jgi:alpha-beta hydrolase superfamily lysophospholipase
MRKPRLDRDGQQWVYDYVVQQTGRVFHWDEPGRQLPASIKSHAQISKHLGRIGQRLERVAAEEEAAGHTATAFELYYRASSTFAAAQHPVLETNDEKRYLHGRCIATYEKVIEHAPYPIERLEIPFEGVELQCNFHMLPGKPNAPLVIFIPGCDMTKEIYPDPRIMQAHYRGMHMLVIDGPGQGMSNIRGIKLTADNYERAVLAIAAHMAKRTEVDETKITVYALSMGAHWGLEVAAAGDPLIKAVAAPWASYLDKYYILDTFSPRYKQLFGYLTGAQSEEELDAIVAKMTVEGREADIKCPVLLTAGEYDARSPVELVYAFYDKITAPKELWVYEDTYHQARMFGAEQARHDHHMMCMDWLVDALAGKYPAGHDRKMYLRTGGGGPNGTQGLDQDALHWWE